MIVTRRNLFLILSFFFLPGVAFAKTTKKDRVVEINFDDELLIKGKVLGPSLFTLYQKRNVEFGRLVEPRKNFLPEMRVTLRDIK